MVVHSGIIDLSLITRIICNRQVIDTQWVFGVFLQKELDTFCRTKGQSIAIKERIIIESIVISECH